MDCPVFSTGDGTGSDELEPYLCPLVYCPPRTDRKDFGNFTFSLCIKHVNKQQQEGYRPREIEKGCLTNYKLCDLGCNLLKSRSIGYLINEFHFNSGSTTYTAVGCIEGDQTSIRNNSSVFPPSSIVQQKTDPSYFRYPIPPQSSSGHLQATIMMPWLLPIILFTMYILKKN